MEEHQNKISEFIVESNNQYLLANKPAGMPVQDDKTKDTSLLGLMESYTKSPMHLVNRLDRPVSGLVLFAKKKAAYKKFAEQQQKDTIVKRYLAVVEGKIEKDQSLSNYLYHHKKIKKAFISDEPKVDYKLAEMQLVVHKQLDNYTLVNLELKTGRFHQIRAQLAHLGHPIKADVKYGAKRGNKDRSILLHAYGIQFNHPVTNAVEKFSAAFPSSEKLWQLV